MRLSKSGMATLAAAACITAGFVAAPTAAADTCDPAVTTCEGGSIAPAPDSSSPDYSPPVVASSDDYPFDGSWYFDPAGGGTSLQPVHPSGGGSGGGGGHH